MLKARIKKRPFLFVCWLLIVVLFAGAAATFWKGVAYFTETRQYFLLQGVLLIQPINPNSPAMMVTGGAPLSGIHPVNAPPRKLQNLHQTIHNFVRPPYRSRTGDLFVPLGSPLFIIGLVVSIAFWRPIKRIGPDDCPSCGYNLTGITEKCPECGTQAARKKEPTRR